MRGKRGWWVMDSIQLGLNECCGDGRQRARERVGSWKGRGIVKEFEEEACIPWRDLWRLVGHSSNAGDDVLEGQRA